MKSLRTAPLSAPQYAAVVVAAVGGMALVGWALDIDFLRSFGPGQVAMNPMTAVALMLAALSLWLLSDEPADTAHPAARRFGRACAAAVVVIGFLKLLEIVFGWPIGADRWLFSDKLESGGTIGFPNRMAPNTAFNVLLTGAALLWLDGKSRRGAYFAQALCCMVALTSLLAVIGYAFNTGAFFQVGTFIPMALHTALSFLALIAGIVGARSDQGPVAIFTSKGQGGIIARRLLPAAILTPMIMGWLRMEGERQDLYGTAFGIALMVTSIIFVFTGLIGWTAAALERADIERKQVEDELSRLQQEQELILSSVSEGIHVIDSAGCIVFENPAAAEMLGWDALELIGRPAHATMHHSHPDGSPYTVGECPIYATLEKDAVTHCVEDEVFWRRDGTSFAVEYSSTPIRGEKGQANGAVVTFRDITARKQNEAELHAAKAEAERASAAKSEFLSRTSHELRTPLNAILGFAQLLELDELNPEQAKGIGQILKGGRHLLELVNEVLDIASIDAGRLALSSEPVQLRDLAQETITLLEPLADERRIRFQNNIGEGFVLADLQRLKQVLLNLISNAVKYNRDGGQVRLESGTAAVPGRVRFEVTDTGPGISPAGLEKVFAPFERLDAGEKEIEGTGIGLTISQRLVHLMDGEIGVQSTFGEGTTFWVELPDAQDPIDTVERRKTARPQLELTAPQNGAARTVLYIEDNLSNLNLIEHILARRANIKLLSAMQGRRGLELAREHRPDLILLDLHLPDIHGDEVLQHLRAESETRAIPVVMLSADATPRQIERLKAAGATEYLTKPLDVKQFMAVLDENL